MMKDPRSFVPDTYQLGSGKSLLNKALVLLHFLKLVFRKHSSANVECNFQIENQLKTLNIGGKIISRLNSSHIVCGDIKTSAPMVKGCPLSPLARHLEENCSVARVTV